MNLLRSYRNHRLLTFAIVGSVLVCAILIIAIVMFLPKKAGAANPPPPEVEVVEVQQKDVPSYSEWIGTTAGMENADIRSQVSGYLLTKNYTEGSFVQKGQLLFEIDPRPFQAALDQAKGNLAEAEGKYNQSTSQLTQLQAQVGQVEAQVLQAQAQVSQTQAGATQTQAQVAQAEANQRKTQLDVNKYKPLREQKAVTQQELDNAVQANDAALAQTNAAKAQTAQSQAQINAAKANVQTVQAQVKSALAQVGTARSAIDSAKAAVDSARAAVEAAEINLNMTKIVSPIDGIAGISDVQVGNLVSPTSGTLTTISTVDPIKVYYTISEQEYLAKTKHKSTPDEPGAAGKQTELEMVLSDGTKYPYPGRSFATDREVDEKTGTIRIAGVFSNPGNALRPGQYAKIRAVTSFKENALLVPQRSITELQGTYQVAVVGSDNKVDIRTVKLGGLVDSQQIITDGLKPGEKVIVGGIQKVKPGAEVVPKPYVPPADAGK